MKREIKLPKEIINLCKKVIPLSDIYSERTYKLPSSGGLYCFWWLNNRKTLLNSNRTIKIKGPREEYITLKYKNWFSVGLTYTPLYVGKTTKLKKRISQHLLLKSIAKIYTKPKNFKRFKPKNATCQLRTGIEYIFPNERKPKDFILENIGLSFFKEASVEKRFYLEDLAIGCLKPWFNLDSER